MLSLENCAFFPETNPIPLADLAQTQAVLHNPPKELKQRGIEVSCTSIAPNADGKSVTVRVEANEEWGDEVWMRFELKRP